MKKSCYSMYCERVGVEIPTTFEYDKEKEN